jgi:hypothetical protein
MVYDIGDCCEAHMKARMDSTRFEVNGSRVFHPNLTDNERTCLYACNGFKFECPYYSPYKIHGIAIRR